MLPHEVRLPSHLRRVRPAHRTRDAAHGPARPSPARPPRAAHPNECLRSTGRCGAPSPPAPPSPPAIEGCPCIDPEAAREAQRDLRKFCDSLKPHDVAVWQSDPAAFMGGPGT